MDWSEVIARLCGLMEAHYLDETVAARVNGMLRAELASGAFTEVRDERALAIAVSERTVAASGDLHLRLRFSRAVLPPDHIVPESGRDPAEAAATGYGFARASIENDVGYLDVTGFWPLSMAREAGVAAMHAVAPARSLVIDLRSSAGGEPDMVSFLASYLFDERTKLSGLYFPADDRTIEWWTDPDVPPPCFGGAKPIYVLIGPDTISAAEAFAYDLQQAGRATLIGTPTAGAANFDYRYRVTDHLMFSVPSGYPVNPVSNSNWEGAGVVPDVEAENALGVAQQLLGSSY